MSEDTLFGMTMDGVEWTPVEVEPPEDEDTPYVTHEGVFNDPVTGTAIGVEMLSDGSKRMAAGELIKFFGRSVDD